MSWKIDADTGNRQGLVPARMVGHFLSENQRKSGKDAGGVFKRAADEGQDWLSSAPIIVVATRASSARAALVVLGIVFGSTVAGAGQSDGYARLQAKHAGIAMTPGKAEKPKYSAAIGALVRDVDKPYTAEEKAAARGMEQMMVDMMITEMRKSVPENEVVPLSQGERIFRQMLDQEYGRMLTETSTLGVADLVLAQMRGKR